MNPSPFQTPIFLDQHAFIVGTTGGGKTTRTKLQIAARIYDLQRYRVSPKAYKIIIIDTKPITFGMRDDEGFYFDLIQRYNGILIREYTAFPWNDESTYLFVYRPNREDINPQNFAEFFMYMANLQMSTETGRVQMPYLIVIDELVDIAADDRTRLRYMHGFTRIMAEGRASLQTIWTETQSPRFIFGDIRRLTTARFIFRLPDPEDRKYMRDVTGDTRLRDPIRDPYGFYYSNDQVPNASAPIYFSGVN